MNIVDIYTLFEVSKAAGKQNFQLLVSEVGDSQQWRISPSNGRTVFDKDVVDQVFYPLILVQIT